MALLNFPEGSDLDNVSQVTRNTWEAQAALRDEWRRYFTGDIFDEEVPLEVGVDEAAPLLYPVGMNLVKLLCTAQADALFGEWEDDIIRWKIRQDEKEDLAGQQAIKMATKILAANHAPKLLFQMALDREIYGGCALKISPLLHMPGHIKWSRIDLNEFYPIWDPEDPDILLEAFIVQVMTAEQARAKYGMDPKGDEVFRVEHWTRDRFKTEIDGKVISAFSGINPWGVVPIVYIPRMRTTLWWGDALTPDIMPVQDEVNMRVADIGEAINYNAHPTRYGYNLPRTFNAVNFPLGPSSFWDLGRVMGNSPEPTVGIMEVKHPVSEGSLEFITFIYNWSRTSAFAPPIAFGEDEGGGQRSGRTLEIRMWPLLRAARRSRAYMGAGLQRAMDISGRILQQKDLGSSFAVARLLDRTVVPDFWPLMPKDVQATVDLIVKLLGTPVPSISLETACKLMGYGPAEVARIELMLKDYPEFFAQEQETPGTNPEIDGGAK